MYEVTIAAGLCPWRTGACSRTLNSPDAALQDFFDSEEGNRESFDYNKPNRSTANPLYSQEGERVIVPHMHTYLVQQKNASSILLCC